MEVPRGGEVGDHFVDPGVMVDVDAEQTIQLAAGDMAGALCDIQDPLFPNIAAVIKDSTHRARRLLERPYTANADTAEVVAKLVTNRSSIMQRSRHNDHFVYLYKTVVMRP